MEAFQSRGRHIVYGRAIRDPIKLIPGIEATPIGGEIKNFLGTNYKMPLKRSYRQKRRQNRRRRRIYRKRPPATIMPYSIARKLKTAFIWQLNPGAGSIATQQIKLNSGYDPTGDIGANQPLGFDQYNALYSRYCVTSWAIHIKAVSTDNTNAIALGFTPKTDNTALTSYLHYLECPGTVSRHLIPDIDKIEYGSKGKVKKYFLPKGGKMLGDDTVCAPYNSDPSKILYGHLWAQDLGGTADPSAVTCVAVLYQTVVFFDPIIPARS